jgi:GAF domain-containing protein
VTFSLAAQPSLPKVELYEHISKQLRSLVEGESDLIANAANFSSLLYHSLPDINWAGVYLRRQSELVLGPFHGKPACVRIEIGKGVCGTAAQLRQTLVVPNVHEFPGHIACDSDSNAEIVVPMVKDGELLGVLDLDSPVLGRFSDEDAQGLNQLVAIFLDTL